MANPLFIRIPCNREIILQEVQDNSNISGLIIIALIYYYMRVHENKEREIHEQTRDGYIVIFIDRTVY